MCPLVFRTFKASQIWQSRREVWENRCDAFSGDEDEYCIISDGHTGMGCSLCLGHVLCNSLGGRRAKHPGEDILSPLLAHSSVVWEMTTRSFFFRSSRFFWALACSLAFWRFTCRLSGKSICWLLKSRGPTIYAMCPLCISVTLWD